MIAQRKACVRNNGMSSIDFLINKAKERLLPPPEERRRLRTMAGFSQAEIAEVFSVDRATISRWETGKGVPRGEVCEKYGSLLDRLKREVLP